MCLVFLLILFHFYKVYYDSTLLKLLLYNWYRLETDNMTQELSTSKYNITRQNMSQ